MSPRNRRLAAAGVVGAVLLVLLAASRPTDPPVISFRVVLGLKDKEPADWSGQVAVAGGEVDGADGLALRGEGRRRGPDMEVPDPQLHRARASASRSTPPPASPSRRRNSPGPTASPSPSAAPRRP